LLVIARDVSERIQTLEALRESEERFRLAAKAASLGVWDFDAITGQRQWSNDLKRILGLSAAAAPDLATVAALVHEEDRPVFDEIVAAAHQRDTRFDFEQERQIRARRASDGE